jgi:predicted Fe-Mo cluster-binding NifX family protein
MRFAVADENSDGLASQVSAHFGHAPLYLLAEVEANGIGAWKIESNPYLERHEPGQIPAYIHSLGAQVMICGGMGRKAIDFFDQYGIKIGVGAQGEAEASIRAYLSGKLPQAEACQGGHQHEDHHHEH